MRRLVAPRLRGASLTRIQTHTLIMFHTTGSRGDGSLPCSFTWRRSLSILISNLRHVEGGTLMSLWVINRALEAEWSVLAAVPSTCSIVCQGPSRMWSPGSHVVSLGAFLASYFCLSSLMTHISIITIITAHFVFVMVMSVWVIVTRETDVMVKFR